jgi:glutathione S-transferase
MLAAPDLALYHYDGCGYCAKVRKALERLGVAVELRDVDEEPEHLRALLAARGRRTVPVLRIQKPEGDEWMPESSDIVRYLERRFGG